MAHRWTPDLKDCDVTPESIFLNRRQLIVGAVAGAGLVGLAGPSQAASDLKLNTWKEITNYNNFYEFGTDKEDPARYAAKMTTKPWSVEIDGLVDNPGSFAFEDILKQMTIEERIYRLRCVERWSLVVPWNGFELADLLKMAGVKSDAKYVAFQTLNRPEEMPGMRYPVIEWPYVEGLRLDEAMHPLTIMATAYMAKTFPIRTARRCVWLFHGNMATNRSNLLCALP